MGPMMARVMCMTWKNNPEGQPKFVPMMARVICKATADCVDSFRFLFLSLFSKAVAGGGVNVGAGDIISRTFWHPSAHDMENIPEA